MADVRRRAGVTSSDASGLGQDVVAAIGDLAQLLDGFIKELRRSAAYRMAVPWTAL
jgi:hypothetical protein